MVIKEQLLSKEPGSLEPKDWADAKGLIRSLRTHPDLIPIPNRVEIMFDVLGRFCQEAEFVNSTKLSKENEKPLISIGNTLETMEGRNKTKPLNLVGLFEGFVLDDVLLAWISHLSAATGSKSRSDAVREKQHASGIWQPNTIALRQGPLGTEAVLNRVERYLEAGLFPPNPKPYSILLHAMTLVGDPRQAPYRAHELYLQLLQKSHDDPFDTRYHPDRVIVYNLIEMWAQSWLSESCARVEGYLKSLQDWYRQTKHEDHRPNANIYCAVMETHGRSNERREEFVRIQKLFSEMQTVCPGSEVDTKALNRVINALAECNHSESADAARAILDDMCRSIKDETRETPKPDHHTFTTVISTYGRAGRAHDAAALFEYMKQLAEETGDLSLEPDTRTRTALIWAYAKVGDRESAESVLRAMMNDWEQGRLELALDAKAWEAVLSSWVESGDPNAGNYVASMIERMLKLSQEQTIPGGGIATSTLNILLSCHARQASTEGAQMAENLFSWMERQENQVLKPDRDSFMQLIWAWCNANDPWRGESVLRSFVAGVREGRLSPNMIDQQHFNLVLEAWAKSKEPVAAEKASVVFELIEELNLKPDVVSYTTLMLAWARSRTKLSNDQVEHVLGLFEKMTKQWRDGDAFAKPTELTVNAVLWTLGRSSAQASLSRAEELFRNVEEFDVKRDFLMYNTLMSGWMRQRRSDKVEELFQQMKKGYENGETRLKPNANVYVTRLQAWSKSGNPEMTIDALNEWIEVGEAESFESMPATQAFNAVLQAWLHSKRKDAAHKTELGLQQMYQLAESGRFDCSPDSFSFSAVISAYAKSDLPQAGERALKVFQELKNRAASVQGNKADILQPTFMIYVEVIVALLRSNKSGSRYEIPVLKLLREVQTKHESVFWHGRSEGLTFSLLSKLKREIEACVLPRRDKDKLLRELDRVNLLAVGMTDDSAP